MVSRHEVFEISSYRSQQQHIIGGESGYLVDQPPQSEGEVMAARIRRLAATLFCFGLIGACAAADSQASVPVPPTDPNIRYVGRFDSRDAAGPRCSWSNSSVAVKFQGTGLSVKLADTGANQWQVVVDGKPTKVITSKGKGDV